MLGAELDEFEFSLDEELKLPRELVLQRFDGKYLFIAPERGIWLTVDEVGAHLIQALKKRSTLANAIGEIERDFGLRKERATFKMKSLLRQIAIKDFCEPSVEAGRLTAKKTGDFNLHLHLTQKCNLRCKHCYMNSGVASPGELTLSEWKDIVDEFFELRGKSVTFSGGEPLTYSGFWELAGYVRKREFKTLLISNGMLVRTSSVAGRLSELFDTIRISVDGCTPQFHEAIRGKGTFAKVNNAIELLSKAGAKVEVAITVYPENYDDVLVNLEDYLSTLQRRAVHLQKAGISRAMPEGRAQHSVDGSRFDLLLKHVRRQCYGALWDLSKFSSVKNVHCGYGLGLTVLSTGEYSPCIGYFKAKENVRTCSLSKFYSQLVRDRERSSVDDIAYCRDCDLRYICGGGCRIESLRRNGDMRVPVCSAANKQQWYRRLVSRDDVFSTLDSLEPFESQ